MIVVFIIVIINIKRKELEIQLDDYLHVNQILLIRNLYVKILQLIVVNRINHFSSKESLKSFISIDTEMTESTTGTLLSLGKTEFDRRIKKK